MIYFLQDSTSNAIKIGYAADPEGRAAALQTGNASELILLHTMQGDRPLEAQLHRTFAKARLAGEWFKPVPDLLRFILTAARTEAHLRGWSDAMAIKGDPSASLQDGEFALWQIDGGEFCDSNGGDVTFYAITDHQSIPPDVPAAFAAVAPSKYSLYCVNSVRLVTCAVASHYDECVHDQRRPERRVFSLANLPAPYRERRVWCASTVLSSLNTNSDVSCEVCGHHHVQELEDALQLVKSAAMHPMTFEELVEFAQNHFGRYCHSCVNTAAKEFHR